MKLHLIDAFTEKAFSGNPAAVVLLQSEPQDIAWMQSVAMEMNQSETAFVWPMEGDESTETDQQADWGLRWFTPVIEVELCGHATLASAHALWYAGLIAKDEEANFYTPFAGHYLSCRLDQQAEMIRMCFPARSLEPVEIPKGLAESLGAMPTHCGRNANGTLLLQFSSAQQVRDINPNFIAMAKATDDVVIVTALSDQTGYDVISRFFAPGKGIDEDPVTGSAHCIIGPWWSRPLKQNKIVCYQASKRGGLLNLELDGDKVYISGKAITTLSGDWQIAE